VKIPRGCATVTITMLVSIEDRSRNTDRVHQFHPPLCASQRKDLDMHTRALVLVFGITVLASLSALGQTRVLPTPLQPVALHRSGNTIIALTSRTDIDFDNTPDPGDVASAWMKFDRTGNEVGRRTLPWANVNALRSYVDTAFNELYVIIDDSIVVYDIATMTQGKTVWKDGASAISMTPDASVAFVSVRPNFTDPGSVKVVNTLTWSVATSLPAGENVQMTQWYSTAAGKQGIIVVSEGSFGEMDGTVDVWEVNDAVWTKRTTIVGGVPNHIALDGDVAYVTMNTSHKVIRIDLNTAQQVAAYNTGTSGFDGPRESVVTGPFLVTTTFAGDVRVFNRETTDRLLTVDVGAKPEGLLVNTDASSSELWITRAFKSGAYDADSGIGIFKTILPTSVEEEPTMRATHAYPNPATSHVVVSGLQSTSPSFRFTSSMGTPISTTDRVLSLPNAHVLIDVNDLADGMYMISDGRTTVKFVVRR